MLLTRPRRSGAVLVEAAFIYPIVFLILLAILMLGLTVFRYQQVTHVACEASRYASVHGATYAEETGKPAATEADIINEIVVPQLGIPASQVECTVVWNKNNKPTHTVIDTSGSQHIAKSVANTVSVTVTYRWNTGWFGTIPVSSTSISTIQY
jgi:Flp pilus assembly protein TadG